jgi:hypothetical protein
MAPTATERANAIKAFPAEPTIGRIIEWIDDPKHTVYPSTMQSIPHFPTHDYASQIWSDAITIHRATPKPVPMQTALDAALFGSYTYMEKWCHKNGVSFDNIRDQLLRTTGADASAIEDVFSPVDLCVVTTLETKPEGELTNHQTTVKNAVHTEFVRRIKRQPISSRHPFAVVRHLATLQFSDLVTTKIVNDKTDMIRAVETDDAAVEGWVPPEASPCRPIHDKCELHTEDWKRLRRLQLSRFWEMKRVDLLAILYVWMRVANRQMEKLVVSADAYKDHMRKYTLLSIERLNQTDECNRDLYVHLSRDVMSHLWSQFVNTLKADAKQITEDGELENIEHEVLQGLAMGAHVPNKPAPTLASVLQGIGFKAETVQDDLEGRWQAIYASIQTNLGGASSASTATGTKRKKPQANDSASSSSRAKSRLAPETPEVPTLDSGSSEEETKQPTKKARQSKSSGIIKLNTDRFKANDKLRNASIRGLKRIENECKKLNDEQRNMKRLPTPARLAEITAQLATLETERKRFQEKFQTTTTDMCTELAETIIFKSKQKETPTRLETIQKMQYAFDELKRMLPNNLAYNTTSAVGLDLSLAPKDAAAATSSSTVIGPTTQRKRKATATQAAPAPSAASSSAASSSAASSSAASSSAASSSAASSSAASSSAASSSAAVPSAAVPSAAAPSAAAPSAAAPSAAAPSAAAASNKRPRIETDRVETLSTELTPPPAKPWSFFDIPDIDGIRICEVVNDNSPFVAALLKYAVNQYHKNVADKRKNPRTLNSADLYASYVAKMDTISKWKFLEMPIKDGSWVDWQQTRNTTWCNALGETFASIQATKKRVSAVDLIRIWMVVRGISDLNPSPDSPPPNEATKTRINQIVNVLNTCADQIAAYGNNQNEWHGFFVMRSAILRWINEFAADPSNPIRRTGQDPDTKPKQASEKRIQVTNFGTYFPLQAVSASEHLSLCIRWMMAEACIIPMSRLRLPIDGVMQSPIFTPEDTQPQLS